VCRIWPPRSVSRALPCPISCACCAGRASCAHGELNVGDIAEVLGLSESAVSHQLRLLRNAHLVRQRRAGQMMFYALDDHHVLTLFEQGLKHAQEGRRRGGAR
jgi:DNA-binding transcriptional ArsR family regulator